MPDIDSFLDELASGQPVPGGGSVAALETAMGGALLSMVANLTLGRKRYAAVQDEVAALRDQALQLCAEARDLAREDASAYGAVAAALALPRDSEAEQLTRRARLQEALKGAALPPLRIMRVARDVAALAGRLVSIGNRSAISDVGVAMLSAQAAFEGARLNVEINLAAVRDEGWVASRRREMDAVSFPDQLARNVLEQVAAAVGGSG